jgi:hypothetical protein
VAKNILTVGAVDDLTNGYAPLSGPAQVQMTGFSGWGPTDDGRIKPDLVGNGMWLVSTWPDAPGYAAALGTSMATPNVTGSLLLLQQHYYDTHGANMLAATLKALAIHTADEAGSSEGPDYAFGWGLLNTRAAAQVISEDGGAHLIIEDSLADGALNSVEINVANPDAIVRATLAWTDPPATPVAPALDPPDLMLVNDLDLRMTRGPSIWLPWILDPADPAAPATRGDNVRDNVEQVVAQVVESGTYSLQVRHEGMLADALAQDYSLVISILPPPLTGSVTALDEDFSGGMPPGWSVQTVQGVPWTIQAPLPGDQNLDNRTGGSGQFAMVNNQFSRTDTSLLTPVLDLSTATNAVLSFNSSMLFSEWERINVDVSTDGGASWDNAWYKEGLIGLPHFYTMDLSTELAGQPNARLRFRYNTFGDPLGYYWQIDNVLLDVFGGGGPPPLGDPPAAASTPFPAVDEVDLAIDTVVNWSVGDDSKWHHVHFGTSSPPPLVSIQGGSGFNPGLLQYDTTYYWRVDEVNDAGTTAGTEWRFTTVTDPSPPPPPPPPPPVTMVHLAGIAGFSTPASRNRWTATVNVTVTDSGGAPIQDVLMEGAWSGGVSGGDWCTTNSSGQCSVAKTNLKGNLSSVVFAVSNLSGTYIDYDPASNSPDNPLMIYQNGPPVNEPPVAAADIFETQKNTPSGGNVLDNDDRGQPEATVTTNAVVTAEGVHVAVGANGDFTYDPPADFVGADSFSYTLANSEGSDSALVTINVTEIPVGGTFSLAATARRDRSTWYVDLTWRDGSGTGTADIYRGGTLIAENTANDGSYTDDLGKKPSGDYTYQVCEDDTGDCADAMVSF